MPSAPREAKLGSSLFLCPPTDFADSPATYPFATLSQFQTLIWRSRDAAWQRRLVVITRAPPFE